MVPSSNETQSWLLSRYCRCLPLERLSRFGQCVVVVHGVVVVEQGRFVVVQGGVVEEHGALVVLVGLQVVVEQVVVLVL